ncbi:MAG: aspartate--tRNA ligase, partial [Pirellulales bacterium]|nr:aspartate--tRNA ligase [Pirellulales bacterium]
MLRTHTCGELTKQDAGGEATLCGWIDSCRDHGGGLFVDLRDRYGITQVVFNPPDTPQELIDASKSLKNEYVIQVTGRIALRPEGMANPKIPTGAIEVRATEFALLNKCKVPPVSPCSTGMELPKEELRLENRFLDLRRP